MLLNFLKAGFVFLKYALSQKAFKLLYLFLQELLSNVHNNFKDDILNFF